MKSMKLVASLFAFFLVASTCQADSECRDADRNTVEQAQCANGIDKSTGNASALPDEALAQVNELTAKMRYFTAIGFHTHSKEKRDEIEAIYKQHGVPLPDEYRE
jgi:hypothetical protein